MNMQPGASSARRTNGIEIADVDEAHDTPNALKTCVSSLIVAPYKRIGRERQTSADRAAPPSARPARPSSPTSRPAHRTVFEFPDQFFESSRWSDCCSASRLAFDFLAEDLVQLLRSLVEVR